MKKYLIGFIVLTISILGIGTVKAASNLDFTEIYNYDLNFGSSGAPDLNQEQLDTFIEYLNKHFDKFVVYCKVQKENNIFRIYEVNIIVYDETSESANIYLYYGSMYPVYLNTFNAVNMVSTSTGKNMYFKGITPFIQSYIDQEKKLPYYNGNTFWKWSSTGINSSAFYSYKFSENNLTFPYYAKGIDLKFAKSEDGSSIIIGNTVYAPNNLKIPTYKEYNERIDFSVYKGGDENGNTRAWISVNFSKVFKTDYHYSVGVSYDNENYEWKNVTSLLNAGIHYNFGMYYNGTVKARVLDSNNNIVYENTLLVNESYLTSAPDGVNPNEQPSINDIINDTDIGGASDIGGSFFEGFDEDDYGLSTIITAPLEMIKSISTKSCTAVSLNVPFTSNNFDLPCMTSIYNEAFPEFLAVYQAITQGIIAYFIAVNIYAMVKGFKDPDNDKIEVADL